MKGGKSSRTYVVDPAEGGEGEPVPFLRGIMTRSLQNAGLPFAEAYAIAAGLKDELNTSSTVTTDELTERVGQKLREAGFEETCERYMRLRSRGDSVRVTDAEGLSEPFSKGHLTNSLVTCAMTKEGAHGIAAAIEQQLLDAGTMQISSEELACRVYTYLRRNVSEEVARRYVLWLEFSRSGRPMLLLIGGTTGTGKSTISSELAHRLGITRTQSTDMLREVIRMMVPERLLPTLHRSSFNAWEELAQWLDEPTSFETHLLQGYQLQAHHVGIGIEGVIRRAEREQISMILEGVHVHPALQQKIAEESEAIVVPVLIAVLKAKQLRKRLKGRVHQMPSRRATRYLEHFDAIWELQSNLLSQADQYQVPIVPNKDIEETIQAVMTTISDYLAREYTGDLEKTLS